MKVTNKGLMIFGGILAGGAIVFIFYNRAKKSAEVDFFLEKIKDFKTQNQGDVNIIENLFKKNLLDTKANPLPKGVVIFNTSKDNWGKITVQLAEDLRKSLEGLGTNTTVFYNTLGKIKSVLEFQMVNKAYVMLTKRNIMDDIYDESAFKKDVYEMALTPQGGSIFLVDKLANYLKNLPAYRFK